MPETLNPAKRWNSFVCPGCRFVFRVAQDHDGKGVVCPACRIMLRLPAEGDRLPPLLSPAREEADDLVDEIEAEGEDDSPASRSGDLKFVLSLAVPALALLALFAWWMVPEPSKTAPVTRLPVARPVETGRIEIEPSAKTLIVEIESVVKSFLSASEPEEVLRYVRDPESTAPKLMAWLGGRNYSPPGFREILSDSVATTAGVANITTVDIRTGDFESRQIVLLEADGNFKVDWESWVGWSEMPWSDFQSKRPLEGKWFRVELSKVEYYNFGFKGEDKWVSYRLDSPDGNSTLFGYAPRGSTLEETIRPIDENAKVKLLLKLKFPPDSESANQVIIDGVKGQEWVEVSGGENP